MGDAAELLRSSSIHVRCYEIDGIGLGGGDDDVLYMCIHLRRYALAHKSVLHN